MKTIAALAMLLAISAAAFGQDPNRNRMNEQFPEAKAQETLGKGAPPATANRMNMEYAEAPASGLAGGPNQTMNRLNQDWAPSDAQGQAERPAKKH